MLALRFAADQQVAAARRTALRSAGWHPHRAGVRAVDSPVHPVSRQAPPRDMGGESSQPSLVTLPVRLCVDPTLEGSDVGGREARHAPEDALQRAFKLAVRKAAVVKPRRSTRCDIPSRRTCWNRATTSVPSKSCWAQRRQNNDDLYACAQPRRARCDQPTGWGLSCYERGSGVAGLAESRRRPTNVRGRASAKHRSSSRSLEV
jgi:hypothetical protein